MIDLRRLHVLRAVDRYGTANALHFTPSAASQQIRQLGRDLNVTLLEPHGRRVRLTPAARSLLGHADAIQARWEEAEIELRAEDGQPTGQLRVCGFPSALSALLAPMTVRLREHHPKLTVWLEEAHLMECFDMLFDGTVDLSIVESTPENPPIGDPRFEQRPLLDDPFDLVVSTRHPFASRELVNLAEAADEDWILANPWSACRAQTLAACTTAGFTPNAVHHVVDWNALLYLIARELGIALVPRMVPLPPHLPIVRVRCTGNPCRKLLTATRNGGRGHPAIAAAISELEDIATDFDKN